MDILNLETNLKYTAACGETLNLDERYMNCLSSRIQLGLALKKLFELNDFDELLFWGRIRGNAYLILA